MKRNDSSPWGPVQQATEVTPGIEFVSTASHGGYRLDSSHLAEFERRVPGWASTYSSRGWFEEDCDACAVPLVFPHAFGQREVDMALKLVLNEQGDNGYKPFESLRRFLRGEHGKATFDRAGWDYPAWRQAQANSRRAEAHGGVIPAYVPEPAREVEL